MRTAGRGITSHTHAPFLTGHMGRAGALAMLLIVAATPAAASGLLPALRGAIKDSPPLFTTTRVEVSDPQAVPAPDAQDPFEQGVAAYDRGDYTAAFRLWKPLADDYDLAAQRNVAHMLRRGLGVEQDARKARGYYERAADRGLPSAQVNLGLMIRDGEGGSADAEDAARWFYEAARSGDANGQYFLAQALETGRGVGQDVDAARAYYAAAAKRGHQEALDALERLGGALPDISFAQGTPKTASGRPASVPKPGETQVAASNLPRKDPRLLFGGTGLVRVAGTDDEIER